jgi:hypothetical protein
MLVPVVHADIGSDLVNSLGRSLSDALHLIIAFVPALLGALVLLLVGWLVARVVSAIVGRLLRAARLDEALERAGASEFLRRAGIRRRPSSLLARVLYYFVFLIFVVAAANALNIPTVTAVVSSIVLWLPNLFVALLVLVVGILLARFVGDLVRVAVGGAGIGGAALLATIARYAIIAFAAIIALDQVGVGTAIVQTLFTAVVGGLALGLALAFGLGGQNTARQIVDSWYRSLSSAIGPAPQATQVPGMPPGTTTPGTTTPGTTTTPTAPSPPASSQPPGYPPEETPGYPPPTNPPA